MKRKFINMVPKVWGEERWIVNKDFCGKLMILKKGYRCSMHFHKNKEETFYIAKGKVLLELDNKDYIMHSGDCIDIKPGSKHRFTGMEKSEIYEFSTHHDDNDSYRLTQSEKVI